MHEEGLLLVFWEGSVLLMEAKAEPKEACTGLWLPCGSDTAIPAVLNHLMPLEAVLYVNFC